MEDYIMRTDILDKKDDILRWVSEGQSKAYIAVQLRCKVETLNRYLSKMGIEYSGRKDWNKGQQSFSYIPAKEYAKKVHVKSSVLKEKLIREGIRKAQCEICGLSEWQNKKIPLELHHKNCNHFDNNFDNLQILCPNCHAQQEGNAGANYHKYDSNNNYKKDKDNNKILCPICKKNLMLSTSKTCINCKYESQRVVERPSREELKELIRNKPFTQIGKMFGVTDNAIRKWCKGYNLPYKSSEIKQYTISEWLKI